MSIRTTARLHRGPAGTRVFGERRTYFVLKLAHGDLTLRFPLTQQEWDCGRFAQARGQEGLRPVARRRDQDAHNWSRRFKTNVESSVPVTSFRSPRSCGTFPSARRTRPLRRESACWPRPADPGVRADLAGIPPRSTRGAARQGPQRDPLRTAAPGLADTSATRPPRSPTPRAARPHTKAASDCPILGRGGAPRPLLWRAARIAHRKSWTFWPGYVLGRGVSPSSHADPRRTDPRPPPLDERAGRLGTGQGGGC